MAIITRCCANSIQDNFNAMSVVDLQRREKRLKTKQSLHTETHKTIKHLIITLSIMIVALLVMYIILTNETGQKGYTLEQEKLKNEDLMGTKQTLDTKITNTKTSTTLNDETQVKTMTDAEIKNYVTEEDNSVK